MLPYQRNKIDISKLNPQEQQLFARYGKLPTHKNMLMKMQKERKYFDSGDYALSKAGVAPPITVGTAIPNPENIPHGTNGHAAGHQSSSISPTNSTCPVNRESSLSHSEIRGDEDRVQELNKESSLPHSEIRGDEDRVQELNKESSLPHSEIRGDEGRVQELNRESSLPHSEIRGDEGRVQELNRESSLPHSEIRGDEGRVQELNRESSLSHSEIKGDKDRVQESEPAADDTSTQPAIVQTGFDEKSEVL